MGWVFYQLGLDLAGQVLEEMVRELFGVFGEFLVGVWRLTFGGLDDIQARNGNGPPLGEVGCMVRRILYIQARERDKGIAKGVPQRKGRGGAGGTGEGGLSAVPPLFEMKV